MLPSEQSHEGMGGSLSEGHVHLGPHGVEECEEEAHEWVEDVGVV